MMLTPSFWSKETPETSSKQTTSYWETRPRWPVALLTNIRATVALPAGDQMGVRRDLLEQVGLARAARAELDHVVVALDERNHAQEAARPAPLGVSAPARSPTLRSRKSFHSSVREATRGLGEPVEHASRVESWIGRSLDVNGRPVAPGAMAS